MKNVNKLILNSTKVKETKLFKEFLKEIILISSYIRKNNIIEIADIEFVFDENYKNISDKTKLLLIELLLEQEKTKCQSKLYEIIINIEKNYLSYIFNNAETAKNIDEFELKNYSIFKNI